MANEYIKHLIDLNNLSSNEIGALEDFCATFSVVDEKSKVLFGNACILLNAMRRVNESTEAMLANEDVLKDDKGEFYQKIENYNEDENPDSNENQEKPVPDNEEK